MPDNEHDEPYLNRLAREEAAKFGITGKGRNDALDAFRHTYISALFSYYGGERFAHLFGEITEIKGDIWGQPSRERMMDEFNNSIGRRIGTTARNADEIGQEVYKELVKGNLIANPDSGQSPSNDEAYIPPIGAPMSFVEGEWDWMRRPGGTGSAASIAGMDITRILGQVSGGSGRSRNAMVMQALLASATGLAREMGKSRRMSLESDLVDILTGDRGRQVTPPYVGTGSDGMSNVVLDAVERMVGGALSRRKTSVSSSESARSVEAGKNWNLSQGQQQAMLAQWAQAGVKNL